MRLVALLLLFCSAWTLEASQFGLFAGPEIYHLKRARNGGTKQTGVLTGVRVEAQRLKPFGWYLDVNYLYATGDILGTSGMGNPLVSDLTDKIFEARIGFTLAQPDLCTLFTPYAGWGCFHEVNDYEPPTLLPFTYTNTFDYIVVGFLSAVDFTPEINVGFNFAVRFMQNGKVKVSNDPLYDDVTLTMDNETQYRIEAPATFSPCNRCLDLGFQITPFYEFRHFGGREGFPFNFKDTKFYLYGLRFSLTYKF